MENHFELDIKYNGADYHFSAAFIPSAYSYRISVDVFDKIILFESDEEGSYRALLNEDNIAKGIIIDKELLQAICDTLALHFKD